MTNDEMAEMIAERNGNQRYCKNCDDCCQPYNSTDDCFKSAMQAIEWKDEQHTQEKQQWIEKAVDWLYDNACFYTYDDYDNEAYIHRKELVDDFKKAMRGE